MSENDLMCFIDGLDGVISELQIYTYLLGLVMSATCAQACVSPVEYESIYFLSDAIADRVNGLALACEKGTFED